MNWHSDVWELPTSGRILADIREDLSQGISLRLINARPDNNYEFHKILLGQLDAIDGLNAVEFDLLHLERRDLSGFLSAITDHAVDTGVVSKLIADDWVPDVLLLNGFDELDAVGQKQILALMESWADECHAISIRKSLCLVIDGRNAHIVWETASSLRIKNKVLVGFPSAIEMQLLCRQQAGDAYISPEDQWRETLIASLSGSDTSLAHALWQHLLEDFSGVSRILLEYAAARSWQKKIFAKDIEGWYPIPLGVMPSLPKHSRNIILLTRGLTVFTPEFGEEIHSAGLALLDRNEELRHRIWRSQSALVAPVNDGLRLKVYSLVKRKMTAASVEGDIPEIGELKFFMESLSSHSWEKQQFYNIICHARHVRNKLAHFEIITLREYLDLWNSWQKVRQMLTPQ